MNDDLISQSALLADIQADVEEGGLGGMVAGALKRYVKRVPAVDAVEVCRCKDCKHSRELNECEKNYLVEEVLICTHPECSDDCWFATWPDHWCSYGERRADDAD